MSNNLITDLSILTTIPELNLKRLSNISKDIISHNVAECVRNGETICETDIGIGVLLISIEEDNLMFKFIPSKSFQDCLIESINSKESSLVDRVEGLLTDKIIYAYKNLV